MSRELPPCDHDECPPSHCLRSGSFAGPSGSETMDALSKTVTTLCLAIDPKCTHGPETEKIAAYARAMRFAVKMLVNNNLGLLKMHDPVAFENLRRLDVLDEPTPTGIPNGLLLDARTFPNAADHRPRAGDSRFETGRSSRGSVHLPCSASYFLGFERHDRLMFRAPVDALKLIPYLASVDCLHTTGQNSKSECIVITQRTDGPANPSRERAAGPTRYPSPILVLSAIPLPKDMSAEMYTNDSRVIA